MWAAHQGETGKLTIDVRDAAIKTTGVGYSNVPEGVHSYDLTTGGTGMILSSTSVRTNDAPAIHAQRMGRGRRRRERRPRRRPDE